MCDWFTAAVQAQSGMSSNMESWGHGGCRGLPNKQSVGPSWRPLGSTKGGLYYFEVRGGVVAFVAVVAFKAPFCFRRERPSSSCGPGRCRRAGPKSRCSGQSCRWTWPTNTSPTSDRKRQSTHVNIQCRKAKARRVWIELRNMPGEKRHKFGNKSCKLMCRTW